jgi:hypothetical protein
MVSSGGFGGIGHQPRRSVKSKGHAALRRKNLAHRVQVMH